MSTDVDKRKPRAPRSPAAETRARILAAARNVFSQVGFDRVGVRELAQAANVDPAIVIRLLGSKEALFAAVANDAFALEPAFDGPIEGLGGRIAGYLMGEIDEDGANDSGFNEFHFLLRSAASPVAGPILSRALHDGFIAPLAARLGGKDAEIRASLLTACVLGFATLRVALGAPALAQDRAGNIGKRLGNALQACLDL